MANQLTLTDIDAGEIQVVTMYVISCFLCDATVHVEANGNYISDAMNVAAANGWHGYTTEDETCSTCCPKCLAEVAANE